MNCTEFLKKEMNHCSYAKIKEMKKPKKRPKMASDGLVGLTFILAEMEAWALNLTYL